MIETRDGKHADEIVAALETEGYIVRVLESPGGQIARR